MQVILHCTPKLFVPRTNVHMLIKFNNPLLPVSKEVRLNRALLNEWASFALVVTTVVLKPEGRVGAGEIICQECWFSPFSFFLSCIWFSCTPVPVDDLLVYYLRSNQGSETKMKRTNHSASLHPPLSISGFYWLFDWADAQKGKFVEN